MNEKEYFELPQKIKNVVDSFDDEKDLYSECERIKDDLNHEGWICDYDLSGSIFNVRKKIINKDI